MHAIPEVVFYGAIIAVLSVVQSVFGIGILLLGTPILLLTGKDFSQSLWTLLPASLAVSLLQLGFDKGLRLGALKKFAIFAIPTLAIGLLIVLSMKAAFKIDPVVGLLLIIGAILRLSASVRRVAMGWLAVHENATVAGIGFIHGLTNMGGGLLSLYASIRHVEKYDIRQLIALGYATFVSAQIVLLATTTTLEAARLRNGMIYAVISASTFVALGRGMFVRVPSARYSVFFSIFEIGCGSVLIVKWLGTTLWSS